MQLIQKYFLFILSSWFGNHCNVPIPLDFSADMTFKKHAAEIVCPLHNASKYFISECLIWIIHERSERLGYQTLLKEIYSGWFLRFISLLSLLHQPKTRHIYIFISETNGREVRKIWDICRNVDIRKPFAHDLCVVLSRYNSKFQISSCSNVNIVYHFNLGKDNLNNEHSTLKLCHYRFVKTWLHISTISMDRKFTWWNMLKIK